LRRSLKFEFSRIGTDPRFRFPETTLSWQYAQTGLNHTPKLSNDSTFSYVTLE